MDTAKIATKSPKHKMIRINKHLHSKDHCKRTGQIFNIMCNLYSFEKGTCEQ